VIIQGRTAGERAAQQLDKADLHTAEGILTVSAFNMLFTMYLSAAARHLSCFTNKRCAII